MNRKMFSINKIAYTMVVTKIIPQIIQSEEEEGIYYAVFPECHAVDVALAAFRDHSTEVNLYEYLQAIKQIRTTMNCKGSEPYGDRKD